MEPIKIMPCLDIKDGRVVKGVKFNDLREAGDLLETAEFYQAEGADELAMLDIAATLEGRKTRLEWVRKVASKLTIPLMVGGGLSSLADIEMVLEAGASRVSLNSAVVKNPELVREAVARFGKSRVVVAIDARRNSVLPSGFELVVAGGTITLDQDAIAWAQVCENMGVGRLLPTSLDGDGTKAGYDLDLLKALSSAVKIPVIASGGAGKLEHFYDAVVKGGASLLLAASVFHFRLLRIEEVKEYLRSRGLRVAG